MKEKKHLSNVSHFWLPFTSGIFFQKVKVVVLCELWDKTNSNNWLDVNISVEVVNFEFQCGY